jgi:hypothetical protein
VDDLLMIKALVVLTLLSPVHDSGDGWHYPKDCCGDGDCEPIACDSIAETSTGFLWRGLTFNREKVRASPNAKCHVCYGKDRFRGQSLLHIHPSQYLGD